MSFYSGRWINSTRKRHRCWWCAQFLEVGERAFYAAGRGEDFWHGHSHPECQAAIDSLPYDDEGFEEWAHARGRTDDDTNAPPQFSPDYRGKPLPPLSGKPQK